MTTQASHPKLVRNEYLSLRSRYAPKSQNIRLVIIAGSPPVSGNYFYKPEPEGKPTEPLFAALMRQLGHSPATKEEGLREFQRRGWVLIDATYEPVNTREINRNDVIARDYSLLLDDLKSLIADRPIPLILIKANVCRILEPKLEAEGFSVLNRNHIVYFPSNGQQTKFHEQFSTILKSAAV